MSPEGLNNSIDKIIAGLNNGLAEIMVETGGDALALIKRRVQEQGINAKEEKFTAYSTRPTLSNCSAMTTSACSTIAGSKKKRRDLKWVTLNRGGKNIKLFELEGGYKQFRELHGRQTDHVDFMVKGNMWNDISIISEHGDHAQGVVIIGPKKEEEKKVLDGNVKKRGDILDLTMEEINTLSGFFNTKIGKLFRENGWQ